MPVTTAVAIFFLIWWVVLFAVLPLGVRSQHEDGEMAARHRSRGSGDPEAGPQAFLDDARCRVIFAAAT